ncbi:lytic murein transglycosylase [Marinivivus vitaminiproducens]|uniref:lytic murein transglycosylase n=1 Tax=Marinivivus vitaminiproducens TaxID=3035935 RepID=UPI0027A39C46|nr:lytic murein transglycosylase [Geminicoccaceae bacterium SCSIO 64248]
MRYRPKAGLVSVLLTLCALAWPADAAPPVDFATWLLEFRAEARQAGVSNVTLDRSLEGVQPIERVVELDRSQPEGRMTFATYRSRVISDKRVADGRRLLADNRDLLERVSARYGVPPEVIVALWGLESSYGRYKGDFRVVDALATLAYEGRRSDLFRRELLSALKIVDQGHMTADELRGSWAGAMGQSQFMPSTYLGYAQDLDGDERADIWNSLPDVFASIANYLSKAGWDPRYIWGRPVTLPRGGLADEQVGLSTRRALPEWQRLGVRTTERASLPAVDIDASVVQPDPDGDAFLVYDNFRSVMVWNRSTYFALSVGLLADRIRHG